MENARSAFDLRLEPVGGRLVIETPIGSFHRPDMPVERGAPIDGIARMSPLDSTAWTCPRGVEIRECSRSSHPQPVSKCPLDPSANRIGGHAMHSYCSTHGFESAAYRGGEVTTTTFQPPTRSPTITSVAPQVRVHSHRHWRVTPQFSEGVQSSGLTDSSTLRGEQMKMSLEGMPTGESAVP
jgi:hypothetical protein